MNQYEILRSMGQELRDSSDTDLRIIDLGAGDGSVEYSPFFAGISSYYLGVDPDHDIEDNEWVDERIQLPAEDFSLRHRSEINSGEAEPFDLATAIYVCCLLYTSPSPRDATLSRMPSSA